eukprot:m.20483 g.20483  ORF g.20483 m.20483 type:complete len:200 (+) comp5575_c0_seq1:220-819(+)
MGTISTVRVTLLAAGVVVCGAAALVLLEPGITLIDAIYLTVATLTTVGYGDISHPTSTGARVVMALMALLCGGVFMTAVEACHEVRSKLDGAAARAIGLGDTGVIVVQTIVNVVVGVQLCSYLSNDAALPSNTLDAVYWAIISGTSVGYGDHVPTTDNGKLAVCGYLVYTMQSWANAMGLAKSLLLTVCTVQEAKAKPL